MRPWERSGLIALGIAVGYVACLFLGAVFSVPEDGFAIIWPARAFLISVLLLLPPRQWWCIGAIVPAHALMAAIFLPGTPAALLASQVFGHLAVAVATAFVVRKMNAPEAPFEGFAAVFKFILLAGLVVPGVIDAAILAAHYRAGWIDDLWDTWHSWNVAGFFPAITIPPLIVLAARGRFTGRPQ